jgi:CheY-like chemotaxis protein
MYQTKNYVLQLGGTIECELENKSSEAGNRQAGITAGTPVFKITLPLSKDTREIRKTILVADDVDVERSTLRTILEKAGYAVLEAATIDSSLEIARSGSINGAIIDVDFHDAENRNGLYLLKEIMKTGDNLRVIVVSGSESGAHSNWQADAKAYGAIGAFDKQDYTAEQILNCLG